MHRYESRFALCTSIDLDDGEARLTTQIREQQANEFASSLLLPERFLRKLCEDNEPSLDFVVQIAELYDVSLTAAARRFVELSPEPCAVVFSKDGYIRWFLGSEEFHEMGLFVDVKSKLDSSTQAARCFNRLSDSNRPSREKVSAWCRSGRYRNDARLLDHSLAMPSYNAVLSLLWVDREIGSDDVDDDY